MNSEVTIESAELWKGFRAERDAERLWQEWRPEQVRARYRIEQDWLDRECVSTAQAVDLGRGLFMRQFTLEEGLGNGLAGTDGTVAGDRPRPNFRRFQRGHFGGPDAAACVNCHWKGGFAGSGDRADNAFLYGDGDAARSHDVRNPPALWGAGWVELVAREMTLELQGQRHNAAEQALASNETVRIELSAKGTSFGTLTVAPDGNGGASPDYAQVFGVDPDLVVKPFGWKGTFTTIRDFAAVSLHAHLNLQSSELVAGTIGDERADLGGGPIPTDPDNDGVEDEFTEGQLTALVLFLATLDTPLLHVPSEGPLLGPPNEVTLGTVDGQQLVDRWFRGAEEFVNLGCAGCHTPFMTVTNTVYRTVSRTSGSATEVDLATESASPRPPRRESGEWVVPVFSDFKRHAMGAHLQGQHVEAGVPGDTYMTRRLWGLANTRPWMHDGSAALLDEAIAMHGGEGSEARGAAEAFEAGSESAKADLRMFLISLRRSPAVRVR